MKAVAIANRDVEVIGGRGWYEMIVKCKCVCVWVWPIEMWK